MYETKNETVQIEPPGTRTIIWRGPRAGHGRKLLRDRAHSTGADDWFGADGWELAALREYREGGDRSSYWEAARLLTVYTFKRPIPGTATGVSRLI